MKEFNNILIVRTDRIGDVILTTPAISALKRAMPRARLSILVAPLTYDLVCGNPCIDEVLIDDRQKEHRGFWGFGKLIAALRKRQFDLAIIFHTKKRTNSLCFWAGIPERVGYTNKKFGFLLTRPIKDDRPQGSKHEAQYCLDLLKAIGIEEGPLEVFVPLQEDAEQWADNIFMTHELDKKGPVFAVHPGASCPTRRWPALKYAGLIKKLSEKYKCSVILIGTNDNRMISDVVIKESGLPVLDLTGKTSLAQLASLLKRCDLLISTDTGPVHIADGLGTPVVCIFTRNQPGINPERWRPLSSRSCFVAPPVDSSISFAEGVVTDARYLENISVNTVLESVDAIFKLC